MKKVSTILFIIILIAISALTFIVIKFTNAKRVVISEEEINYLQSISPIKIAVDPDWEPFEKLDEKGNYTGIAADYLSLIENRLNISFKIVPTENWIQSIQYSKEGKVTVLSFLNKTEEREKWLIFTETLLVDVNVIIGMYDTPYIEDLSLVANKIVALPRGTSVEERLRKDYPNLTIIITETEEEAFKLVTQRKADFTIRSMLVGSYEIRKKGWFDLKVIGQVPNYSNYLRMGISKDEKMLQIILNKAILSITEQERVDILNKHVPLRVEMPNSYQKIKNFLILTIFISSIFLVIIAILSYWAGVLKRKNKEITEITTRYEELSELAGTYFWQIKPGGMILYVSKEVHKVLGYDVNEILGNNFRNYMVDKEKTTFQELIEGIRKGEAIKNFEALQIAKDGTRIWMNINAMPIWDEKHNIVGYRGSCTDIQVTKKLQQALIITKDEIELAYYQAQIAPHFLFNALSAIAMYSLNEPKKASKLIIDLSFFLRKSFDFKSIKSFVKIEEEIEIIQSYINIERARFGNRLEVEYNLDPMVPKQLLIPPLILQPLVENAINHGIMKRLDGGKIIICTKMLKSAVRFEVSDDGVGMDNLQIADIYKQTHHWIQKNEDYETSDFKRKGVGLRNINARLIKLYNTKLEICRNNTGGTTIIFELPINYK